MTGEVQLVLLCSQRAGDGGQESRADPGSGPVCVYSAGWSGHTGRNMVH
jgi:hypothetical protein